MKFGVDKYGMTTVEPDQKLDEYQAFVSEFTSKWAYEVNPNAEHAAIGMATEASELLDLIKKKKYYDKPYEDGKALDEGGDMLFYLTMWLTAHGYTLINALDKNTEKLKTRYAKGFTPEAARNRNPAAENAVFKS